MRDPKLKTIPKSYDSFATQVIKEVTRELVDKITVELEQHFDAILKELTEIKDELKK